ncbi:hypothetical protein J3E68DRAFT_401637 [Trichoderma sp. SZMC 28012]
MNWHYQVQQPLLPRFSKTEPRYGKQWVMALNFRYVPSAAPCPSRLSPLYSYKSQLKLTSTRWRERSGRCH